MSDTLTHYIVLWSAQGSNVLFEADVITTSPKDARKFMAKHWPNDVIWGVKVWKGNGRFC